jgi:hypothetical protein
MKTSFGVVTCNRPGLYLHGMLESLALTGFTDQLHLSVGHHDGAFLDRYRGQSQYRISVLTPQETEEFQFEKISRGARCSLGHYCLMRAMLADQQDLLVLFEDDGKFARGWRPRMEQAIQTLQGRHGDRWILSLFHAYRENRARYDAGELLYPADPATYFGSQGIVYPRKVAGEFLEHLGKTVQVGEKATDTAMRQFTLATKIPLFFITPCLMEHMGDVSVGHNPPYDGYFYRAGCFVDPIP